MSSVLVTGGTGLVGSRLLPRLVAAGFDCRALVRGNADLPPGTSAVRGDLANPDALTQGANRHTGADRGDDRRVSRVRG